MDYFLVLLYVVYLVGLGQAWLVLLARPSAWHWTQLAWAFGIGTVVWGYGQFLLNVFDVSTHGMRLYAWQMGFVIAPMALRFVIPEGVVGDPSLTSIVGSPASNRGG